MRANLEKYIRARRAIIWCNTSDYKEIDDLLKESVKNIENKEIYEFRALGVIDFNTKEILEEGNDIYQLIDSIFAEGFDTNVFLLIKDSKEQLEKPEIIAYLKKIAEMRYSNHNYNFTILVIGESNYIPKELEEFVSILEIENMKQDEIEKYILEFGNKNNVKIDEEDIGELAISLKGLTKLEIDHILNMMIENKNTISISDRNIIIKEKGQIIKKSAILELIDFKEKITDIGGLEGLKEWLDSKAKIFRNLDEAITYGVDVPKGVLLVGMPGCGKSLAAKASARLFNAPLLRLDIGRLLGKYVGESEHNMRVALKTAESISPCILWIDEIEKAFAGIDQSGGASDITKRLFGQFLTWLQEKENTVFVVATANDISCFPPEFLRKGRFDEVFFVDFPNEEERERIFEIHLEKRGKKIENINLKKLAKATVGYCGADIEEIVKLTLERAFVNKVKEINTQSLLDNVREIDSLSEILKNKIEILKKNFEKFKIKSASEKKKFITDSNFMVYVQGGKFKPSFGNENINKNKIKEKKVTNLMVGKYPVSKKSWDFLMGNLKEISHSNDRYISDEIKKLSYFEDDNISVELILKYCNKLSEIKGLKPVYDIKDSGIKVRQLDGKIISPDEADFKKTEGYRLPTELEWEWICNGGEIAIQNGTFDNYKYPSRLYAENFYIKNELGIYFSSSILELCYDTYKDNYEYEDEEDIDYLGDKEYIFEGYKHIYRNCSVLRTKYKDYLSSDKITFRIVRTIK